MYIIEFSTERRWPDKELLLKNGIVVFSEKINNLKKIIKQLKQIIKLYKEDYNLEISNIKEIIILKDEFKTIYNNENLVDFIKIWTNCNYWKSVTLNVIQEKIDLTVGDLDKINKEVFKVDSEIKESKSKILKIIENLINAIYS